MNAQWWVVAPLVLIATLYAIWRLAPLAARARVRRALGIKPEAASAACSNCRERRP